MPGSALGSGSHTKHAQGKCRHSIKFHQRSTPQNQTWVSEAFFRGTWVQLRNLDVWGFEDFFSVWDVCRNFGYETLMYRFATGWVHVCGVSCMKCFYTWKYGDHTFCIVAYIVHCSEKGNFVSVSRDDWALVNYPFYWYTFLLYDTWELSVYGHFRDKFAVANPQNANNVCQGQGQGQGLDPGP